MSDIITIPYLAPDIPLRDGWKEFKESGDGEDYDAINGTVSAKRIFDGPWIDRINFLREILLGATETDGNQITQGGYGYPDFPEAIATKANVKKLLETGLGSAGQIWHGKARVAITYETQSFNSNNNENPDGGGILFADESGQSVSEILTIDGSYFNVDGQAKPEFLKRIFHKTIIHINHTIHFPIVIRPLWDNINAALGKINLSTFTFPSGATVPPFTLRYDGIGYATKREILRGRLSYELNHLFVFNPNTWLKQWTITNPGPNGILELKTIQPPLYEIHTFNDDPVFVNETGVLP